MATINVNRQGRILGTGSASFSTASTSVVSIDFGTAPPNDCRALITSLAGATAGSIAYT